MSVEGLAEAILAAVRLVGDHHNVATVSEHRVAVAVFARCELLQRGEDDAARGALELGSQVGAGRRLHGRLWEDAGRREGFTEELVVEVVAVGDEHQGRVCHALITHDLRGVEHHLEALARPLRVPHHATATVPIGTGSLHGGLDGRVDGPVLVILGHALHECPRGLTRCLVGDGLVAEDGEVLQQIKEALRLEDSLDQHFKRGEAADDFAALDRLPRRVVLKRTGVATHRSRGAV